MTRLPSDDETSIRWLDLQPDYYIFWFSDLEIISLKHFQLLGVSIPCHDTQEPIIIPITKIHGLDIKYNIKYIIFFKS